MDRLFQTFSETCTESHYDVDGRLGNQTVAAARRSSENHQGGRESLAVATWAHSRVRLFRGKLAQSWICKLIDLICDLILLGRISMKYLQRGVGC